MIIFTIFLTILFGSISHDLCRLFDVNSKDYYTQVPHETFIYTVLGTMLGFVIGLFIEIYLYLK